MLSARKYSIITGDGEQVVHRDIEETLNLRGVQIERQNAVRPRRFQQAATSLAEIGTRGLSFRSCRAYP